MFRRPLLVAILSYAIVWSTFFALTWSLETRERTLGDELAAHGVVTTARVVSSDPGNHNQICFTFEANGRTHSACGRADFDKTASQLPAGSETQVTYSNRDPNIYCVCSAQSLEANAYQAPIVGAFWLGTFLWASIYFGLRGLLRRPSRLAAQAGGPVHPTLVTGQRSWIRPGLPTWLWTGGTIFYRLNASPETVAAAIAAQVKPEGLFDSLFAAGRLRGWVTAEGFKLTTHLPLVGNSLDSILEGRFSGADAGTQIVAKFRLRGIGLWFLVVWETLAVGIGLVVVIGSIAQGTFSLALLLVLLFPAFGVLLLVISRLVGIPQERSLVRLLDSAVGATPAPLS